MDESAEKIRNLLRQQSAIADFGSFALRQNDLQLILNEAAKVCAHGLGVSFSKVCRYRSEEDDLLIEAGYGWKPGVIGHSLSRADATSPQGRAFATGRPSICNDLREDNVFELPSFYAEHGIVSTVDVVIVGPDRPYGVLEIDSDRKQSYDQHDIDFLTGFANVLAEAVSTSERTAVLKATVARVTGLVEEKDHLLHQTRDLLEELQHRVRNNLQLVYAMLRKQLDETSDASARRGIGAVARRVSTLARVYEGLIGPKMSRTADFGPYVGALCADLAEFHPGFGNRVTLICESEPLVLDLDTITALGIIVSELVANVYDHAFPAGAGEVRVAVRNLGHDAAQLVVTDDGVGLALDTGDKRHGIGLMKRLVEQIRGTAVAGSGPGTAWTITFPTTGQLLQ